MKFDEEKAVKYGEETASHLLSPITRKAAEYYTVLGARWQYEQGKDLMDRAMKLLETFEKVTRGCECPLTEEQCEARSLLSEYRGEA